MLIGAMYFAAPFMKEEGERNFHAKDTVILVEFLK